MKGFTHFMSAIAATTFIPEVVRMSSSTRLSDSVEGAASSFIMLLPGVFGLLPDTMDFKMGQYFSIAEYEIDPDPRDPNPQAMTDVFAQAVNEAGDTGKDVRVQLFPIQLGASLWRQYNMIFEPDEVLIQFNEIVKTSQIPLPGTAPPIEKRLGRTKLRYELKSRTNEICWMNKLVRKLRYALKGPDHPPGPVKPSTLDILSGTQFAFHLESDGKIYFNWLPWHRTWSHSYVLGCMLAVPVFVIAFLIGMQHWWLYGLVCVLGFTVHLTEDMTGHIGGALFWPLHKPRSEGLELFKASDPRTNFFLDYSAIMLIVWNLDRFTFPVSWQPAWFAGTAASLKQYVPEIISSFVIDLFAAHKIPLPGGAFLLLFWVLPMVVYFWFVADLKKKLQATEREKLAQEKEMMEEPDGTGEAVVD